MCLSFDAIISQTILRQSGNIFKIVIWNLELCLLAMTVRLAEKVANECILLFAGIIRLAVSSSSYQSYTDTLTLTLPQGSFHG